MQQEPRCTHTNEELILRVKDWIINLAKSGGKAWTLQIPANVNEDPDLLIGELITRFKAMLKPGGQSAGTWVKASERLPAKTHNYYTKEKAFNGVIYNSTMFFHTEAGWARKSEVLEWLDEAALPDNKDREITFLEWAGSHGFKYNKGNWYKRQRKNRLVGHSGYLHYLWQQSLTNKP